MSRTLPVAINGDSVHSIEPGSDAFETDGTFTIDLENAGEATHVHLHLDDELSRAASLGGTNHFVEANSTRPVRVRVDGDQRPVTGRLKIVTGYGAETEYVDVTIEDAEEPSTSSVQVDERLSVPQPPEEPTAAEGATLDAGAIAIGVLAAAALVLAIGAALVSSSPAVMLGVAVVLLGVAAAVYFLAGQ